ncbi:MAG: hypothetical protein R3F59_03755 [Myxococcota bacterium]
MVPEEPPLVFAEARLTSERVHQLKVALAEDPSRAPAIARQLTDVELGALSLTDRLSLVDAFAKFGGEVDALQRVLSTTPDADAGSLYDSLDDDRLGKLRTLYGAGSSADLDVARFGLSMRRDDWPPMLPLQPPIDFAAALRGPVLAPGQPIWVGGQPAWAKDLRLWTDPAGNTNIWSPDTGLSSFDAQWRRRGPMLNPELDKIGRIVDAEMELARNGGKRFVPGVGLLDEAQWTALKQQLHTKLEEEGKRRLERLEGGVAAWDETQSGLASVPSGLSHILANRRSDTGQKLYADAEQDLRIALKQLDDARVYSQLDAAAQHVDFATRHGERGFFQYKEDVYGGAGDLITGLEAVQTAADVTLIVLTVGEGAVVVGSLRGLTAAGARTLAVQGVKGAAWGMGIDATRQGIQIAEGSKRQFSWTELGMAGGTGLVLGPAAARNRALLIPMSAMGARSAAHELSEGHYYTAGFDALMAASPLAERLPAPGPRARALAFRIAMGMQDATGLDTLSYGSTPGSRPEIALSTGGGPPGPGKGSWATWEPSTGLPEYPYTVKVAPEPAPQPHQAPTLRQVWEQTRNLSGPEIARRYPAKVVPRHEVGTATTPRGRGQERIMGQRASDVTGQDRSDWLHLEGLVLGGEQAPPNLIAGRTGPNYVMLPLELNVARMARGTMGAEPGVKMEVEVVGLVDADNPNLGRGIIYRVWRAGELVWDTYLDVTVDETLSEAELRFWRGPSTKVE